MKIKENVYELLIIKFYNEEKENENTKWNAYWKEEHNIDRNG